MTIKLLHSRIPIDEQCFVVITIYYLDPVTGLVLSEHKFFIRSSIKRIKGIRERLCKRIPSLFCTRTGYYKRDWRASIVGTATREGRAYFKRGAINGRQTAS